jgi:hypothetical protein
MYVGLLEEVVAVLADVVELGVDASIVATSTLSWHATCPLATVITTIIALYCT